MSDRDSGGFAEYLKSVVDPQPAQSYLLEALKNLVHLHLCEQEGISSGMPTREQWLEAVDKASKAITKAEGGAL